MCCVVTPVADDAGPAGEDASGPVTPPAPECGTLPNGNYCGNNGIINGQPGYLYQCVGGVIVSSGACPLGCGKDEYGNTVCLGASG